MSQRLKIIFADFLRTLRQLWLELVGGIFLGLGVIFILAAIHEYRKYVSAPETGTGRFLLVVVSSAVMLFFALESFWKSRKPR
jgi:4-amino-4-deoxy-L-arabinose transferase-like glycosyltransferase